MTRIAKKEAPRKRRMVRLLPLTITMLSLLFIIKMNEVYLGSRQLREVYGARDAVAEEKKADAAHGKEEEKKADATGHGDAKKEEAKKEDAHGEPKKEEGGHGEAKKDDGHGGGEKPVEEEKTFGTGKSTVKAIEALKARDAKPLYTQTELDLLQNLSKRRDELEQRNRDLDIKAKVLEASEKRITDKISEMKTLEADLSKVLAQYNVKQDDQIKSLVKIYESMKPDEAAAIFNELEMPILLDVVGKMSERKVALVLANMSPKRARDVTQELADRRRKEAQTAAVATASAPSVNAPAAKPAATAPVAAPAPVVPAAPAASAVPVPTSAAAPIASPTAPTPPAAASATAPTAAPAADAAHAAPAPAKPAEEKAKH